LIWTTAPLFSTSWRASLVLPDVNVLVYAYREDAEDHDAYHGWLDELVNAEAPFAISELVLSAFVRIVTHPRIWSPAATTDEAFGFVNTIIDQPNCVPVAPGHRHWGLFERLCRSVSARGNLVPDAYLAALAIESGSEWVTTDRDYSRFPGLRWRHPLDQPPTSG
jgi:toxin-antitoxin system PIN domain toxin